jgi:hypothetical protein
MKTEQELKQIGNRFASILTNQPSMTSIYTAGNLTKAVVSYEDSDESTWLILATFSAFDPDELWEIIDEVLYHELWKDEPTYKPIQRYSQN